MRWDTRGLAVGEQGVADGLAEAAVAPITTGTKVGLGAGRTAARAVRALGDRVRLEGLSIECACASESAEALAREQGLTVIDFATVEELDWLIDGADEVDSSMRLMKGSRGTLTRERMLAWASRNTVYMVLEDKVSEQIGTHASLTIAVMYFGLASTRKAIGRLGINTVIRHDHKNEPFITENGNLILDAALRGNEDIEHIYTVLHEIPGVIDHGLYLHEADTILIERERGSVERLERGPDED